LNKVRDDESGLRESVFQGTEGENVIKRLKFSALLGAIGAVFMVFAAVVPAASAATPNAADSSTGISGARVNHVDVSQIKDFSGWHVEYWGPGYSSGTLDASIAANRNISHVVPARVREAAGIAGSSGSEATAKPSTAAVGFVCSLYVGGTYHSGTHLTASTAQTCTGAFRDQWTAAQFDRSSWTGWRTYGPVITSASTTSVTLDDTFWVQCTGGGTYDYALSAIPWAQSSEDGTTHNGPLERGSSSRYPCGT
jgi:hypothetical protein